MDAEPSFSPSERLILAAYHADDMCELLEEFADTDGVIAAESARALWQKMLLASLGHSPSDHAAAMEKLWARLGRLTHEADPALIVDEDALLADALACGDELWETMKARTPTPAAMCLVLARLSGRAAEALLAAER